MTHKFTPGQKIERFQGREAALTKYGVPLTFYRYDEEYLYVKESDNAYLAENFRPWIEPKPLKIKIKYPPPPTRYQFKEGEGVICKSKDEVMELVGLAKEYGYAVYQPTLESTCSNNFCWDGEELIGCLTEDVTHPLTRSEFVFRVTGRRRIADLNENEAIEFTPDQREAVTKLLMSKGFFMDTEIHQKATSIFPKTGHINLIRGFPDISTYYPLSDFIGEEAETVAEKDKATDHSITEDPEVINPEEHINHPEYYGGANSPYEAIKIIEALNLDFHLGNALKYIVRNGKKEDAVKDLKKAIWYLNRRIELIENG